MALLVLVKMFGAVMLLLYAVRMVRTGFERASGPALRRLLASASAGPVRGALAGASVAILLQSSTAVAMLAAGFAASGFLTGAAGLAVLLGADVGSSLVVQFLVLDLSWLVPLLLAVGGWCFLKFESRAVRQSARIMLGIAFILLSLQMIAEATEPLKQLRFMPQIAGYLAGDPLTAMVAGAMLALVLHSSVAAVLMVIAFVGNAGFPLEAAVPLVLGINVGAGLIGVWLTRGMDSSARVLPLGNFVFRLLGAIAGIILFSQVDLPLHLVPGGAAQQVVAAHVLFNIALLFICLPLTRPLAWALARLKSLRSSDQIAEALEHPSALDHRVVHIPRLALASATRELLRMGELVMGMAGPVMGILESGRPEEIARLRGFDRQVNELHSAIKLYIAEVNRAELTAAEAERSMELVSFAVNLERAGDLIVKNLLDQAENLRRNNIGFSKEGLAELITMHDRVLANMQLALNVLISSDLESARELISEKERMRALERGSHDRHLTRLREKTPESLASSNAHMEVVRSLKEINSLFAAVAVPILVHEGQLRESRLVPAE
ncbi:Na/Pi cotransporter family protein [Roseibium sp.]|uniref:Na/Pi cotransporter family protein n=1 Tax=Roseibium sp. TaxID=1936156 RepID=UPI003A96A8B8